DGRNWMESVREELQAIGYEVAIADLPASAVGAPHIRQRLFWVAVHGDKNLQQMQGDQTAGSIRSGEEIGGQVSLVGSGMRPEAGKRIRRAKRGSSCAKGQGAAAAGSDEGSSILSELPATAPGQGDGSSCPQTGDKSG